MSDVNFWNDGELEKYLRILHDAEAADETKLERVRRRLQSGYYLTDEIARATAEKMIRSNPDRFP